MGPKSKAKYVMSYPSICLMGPVHFAVESTACAPAFWAISHSHCSASPELYAQRRTCSRSDRWQQSSVMSDTTASTPAGSVWSRMMESQVLPCEMAVASFCSSATFAPASKADSAAGTPAAPAPTTTTS